MIKLKKGQEAFTIMDGLDAGRTFRPDMTYPQAPKGYESRFEKIQAKPVPESTTDRKRSK